MQNRFPANRLLSDPLRIPLEQAVSAHLGREWKVSQLKDMRDFACHPATILTDGSYAVFAKLSDAANGLEQFEIELAGLGLLSECSGVRTPTPIGIVPVEGAVWMVFEAVQEVSRESRHWRQIGRALAQIHKVKGERYGLESQGYLGPLYQDNRPMHDWTTFFAERRLWPRLVGACDSGNLPGELIQQVERLIARLPDLLGSPALPALLHGDAQQNNYISTEAGVVVIDPAVFYGDPEYDLAFLDYFQPVPEDVFLGYQEELPIEAGFWERRDLYRVYGYLAAVTVEGAVHLDKLVKTLQRYS